jgi:type VI secretion system VasD/TssJ family lipoprotein
MVQAQGTACVAEMVRHLVVASFLAVPLLCGSCGPIRMPCDPGQNALLVVQTSSRVNLAEDGRSLPTIVRIYQLKSIAKFENAEFEELWRKDKETLGEDMLSVDDLTVYPVQTVRRLFKRNPKATHLVAMAIYRQPAGISWRVVYELPPSEAEKRCALLQLDPKVKLKLPLEPKFYLYLEDYRMEPLDEPIPDPERKKGQPKTPAACCDA